MKPMTSELPLVIERTIDATPEEVFDAWLDSEMLAVWMRPGNMTHSTVDVEPKVGGRFKISMHGPSGVRVHTGVYRELDRPRRLAFTWASPATEFEETLVTILLRADRGKTILTLTHDGLAKDTIKAAHVMGWTRILELLDQSLSDLDKPHKVEANANNR